MGGSGFGAGLINPLEGIVTSTFGMRKNPVTGDLEFHNGIDIAADIGTDIRAVCGATVAETGENSFNGKYLVLRHEGAEVIYAHLSGILVKEGDAVKSGQVIAQSGDTGVATGPHLHYGLRANGDYIDPYPFVSLGLTEEALHEVAQREDGSY